MMRKLLYLSALCLAILAACTSRTEQPSPVALMRVEGTNFVTPEGDTFFIRGTNLGNWLNPEGYMFEFSRASSPRLINEAFCQLVGPDATARFWKKFKDNYITRRDIEFIASTGANTIRLPFHYKIFTAEDYMGCNDPSEGFRRVDSVVEWCRDNGLYLILDMHDCPGGQTGDNIDDSYGYPWLFANESSQRRFCEIWRDIAGRYASEPVVMAYELMNEPIAHFFSDRQQLNAVLPGLMQRAVDSIRRVDPDHIILLGGAQWNSNFHPLSGYDFGPNIAYTCHRYGGEPTPEAIDHYIAFRDSVGLPMYMGEIGHNTDQWQAEFVSTMEANNIGYTFWPYKKISGSCMNAWVKPAGWDSIVAFAEAPRGSYGEVRAARPSELLAINAMTALLEAVKAENCLPQESYISSMKLTLPQP